MNQNDFVALARTVIKSRGEPYQGGLKYEDEKIMIRTNYNGLDLEVTRKPMPEVSSDLRGDNPTTMVSEGDIIRHHGEAAYLDEHLKMLAEQST